MLRDQRLKFVGMMVTSGFSKQFFWKIGEVKIMLRSSDSLVLFESEITKEFFFFQLQPALYLLVTWDADGIALVQGFGVDGWTSMI